jgi:hypothetical protein
MAKYVRVEEAPIRSWITLLGILPLYGGIGFAMTGYINFWAGIAVLVLTAGAFAIHFWLANKRLSPRLRIVGVIVIFGALGLTLWAVFVPAPLQVVISAPSNNYRKGTRVLGLEWKEDEAPVRFTITNDTDLSYENFDSYYKTDLMLIARVGVYGGINTCTPSPENTAMTITQSTLSAAEASIPVLEPDQQNPATIYRVRCDKLSPHSHIDVVLAVANTTKPAWAIGSFRYDAVNRHRGPKFFPKCLADKCSDLPSMFVGG